MQRKQKSSYPLTGGYYIKKDNEHSYKVKTALLHNLYDININKNKVHINEILTDGSLYQIGSYTPSDFLNHSNPSFSIESSFNDTQASMAIHLAIHGILHNNHSSELINGWI